ncbi:hypothetical protein BH09BAC5_BH09BAC5_05850 [soil metagenome]
MKISEVYRQSNIKKQLGKQMKALFISGIMISSVSVFAQDGATVFKNNCSACHSIGKGKLVGPDLKGVTDKRKQDWLMKWVKSSQTLVNSGDADAKAIFEQFNKMPMPDQNITDAEITSILAFIKQSSSSDAVVDTTPVVPSRSSDDATALEIQMGQDLFQGIVSFQNGGPSCISCHNVNYNGVYPGGLLAKDLTQAYSRVGGDVGLQGLLGSPAFPAMQVAFGDRKLSDKEIYALTAFLNTTNKANATRSTAQGNPLLYGGGPGAVILLIVIFLVWFNRKRATVKREIYSRQLKSK